MCRAEKLFKSIKFSLLRCSELGIDGRDRARTHPFVRTEAESSQVKLPVCDLNFARAQSWNRAANVRSRRRRTHPSE